MSWLEYVLRIAGTDGPKAMNARTGLDGPHMSKWKSGTVPTPPVVAQFARGYGRPVLEAFVAAGFLSAEEAGEQPLAAPDYTQLTNDELLELVRARMREEGEGHDRSPANKVPETGPGQQPVLRQLRENEVDLAARPDRRTKRRSRPED